MPSLFARLRPAAPVSSPAYYAAVKVARAKHWYIAGAVPDTMDGRFALLTTVLALVTLRLEAAGPAGVAASVGLTEAFIADMDAQMRQEGFDATLSTQVRQLVGSLASRVDRWRRVVDEGGDWDDAVRQSVYRGEAVADGIADYCSDQFRLLWQRLGALSLDDVVTGKFA